ncbi:MAG: extracellular solute-binding protein [Cryobacterium sp.]|nr:extracellular solute-binding protein [Cryobacterium sp.]
MDVPELNKPAGSMSKVSNALSRRGLLQGTAIGASAMLLAACSSKSGGPTAAADKSTSQKSLRVDGKETYRNVSGQDFPLLDKFTYDSGIKVTFTNQVDDDNLYYQEVRSQLQKGEDIGADAAVLADWMAAKWSRLGYIQPIDSKSISNFNNVSLTFRNSSGGPLVPGTMPWRAGITGIAWNKEYLPDGLTSISQLWDESLHGRVGAMSSLRETMGLIMLDRGVDISSGDWGDKEFSEAVDFLRPLVTNGQLRSIKGDKYKDDLVKVSTIASIARAGDIQDLNQQAGKEKWGFGIPDKGGVLWADVAVVPIGSTHAANAARFINYYYRQDVAVQVAATTGFISPVTIRSNQLSTLPSEVSRNVTIFPTDAVMKTVKMFRQLTPDEEQRFTAQFQSILLAASS